MAAAVEAAPPAYDEDQDQDDSPEPRVSSADVVMSALELFSRPRPRPARQQPVQPRQLPARPEPPRPLPGRHRPAAVPARRGGDEHSRPHTPSSGAWCELCPLQSPGSQPQPAVARADVANEAGQLVRSADVCLECATWLERNRPASVFYHLAPHHRSYT